MVGRPSEAIGRTAKPRTLEAMRTRRMLEAMRTRRTLEAMRTRRTLEAMCTRRTLEAMRTRRTLEAMRTRNQNFNSDIFTVLPSAADKSAAKTTR